MKLYTLLWCLILAANATGAHAAPDRFVIDAQYRGMVTKNFAAIGSASIEAIPTGAGKFTLIGSGQAKHPMKSNSYQATVDMKVTIAGGRLSTHSASKKASPGSEQFAGQIQEVMPILTFARTNPGVASGAVKSLSTPAGSVQLASRNAGATVEVTAQRGATFVAKIFMSRAGAGFKIDRFRVPALEENVMLNFVSAGGSELARSTVD